MGPYTFFICANETEFNRARHSAINGGIMKAAAAFTIVVCVGTKEEVLAKGMPNDITHFEGDVPEDFVKAIPDEFIRKNVDRVSKLYGSEGPGEALIQKRSMRFHRGEKKVAKTEA